MKRTLLLLVALFISASFSFFYAADPTNPDLLSQGFDTGKDGATYDAATKTITFPAAWTGMRWEFWGNEDKLAEYQTCTIEFEPVDFYMEFIIANWNIAGGAIETLGIDPGTGKAVINVKPATEIMIQGGAAGTVTLKAAYLTKEGGEPGDDLIIMDFSEVPDGTNQGNQQGWRVNGILEEIAAAKYLVIETEGTGDNANGFGGFHLIFQGNDADPATIEVGWTDRSLNGDWISFPRAAGKTVSIALDLKNTMGDKYENFLKCVNWSRILLGYYGGSSAYNGLGFIQAYLTKDFEKPAGSVNLTGGTDWGFIFEGSILPVGIRVPEPAVSRAFGIAGGIMVNGNNEKVSIYTVDGRLVKEAVVGNNTTLLLSRGIYVAKVGVAKPVKVIVR